MAFVPITIAIFKKTEREKYIAPVVVLETISANLGSMITPFGNPQNLFLFDKMGIKLDEFVLSIVGLYIASLILLLLSLLFIFRHDIKDEMIIKFDETEEKNKNKGLMMFYFCLLIFVLSAVLGYANWFSIFIFFMLFILCFDRSVLKKVDWALLATFLCFFVFSTSLSLNGAINAFLSRIVSGHEFIAGIVLSQVISNVPTAILLEPFATNLKALLFGVDIGGLGTIIASLASLISFRLYSKENLFSKRSFLLLFTIWNIVFLIALTPIGFLILSI